MLRKGLLSVTMAGVLMVGNVAFAGFSMKSIGGALGGGVKKVTGVKPAPEKKAAKSESVSINLNDLTRKEKHLVETMNAAMVFAALAHTEVGTALGKTDTDLVATTNLVRGDRSAKGGAKKIGKALKPFTQKDFDSVAMNGSAQQKANLKAAMEKAHTYKLVSTALIVAAAAQAPGVLQEASAGLKGLGNFNQIQTVNGVISTCRGVGAIESDINKYFSGYGKASANAKALLKPAEATTDSAAVKTLIRNAQDGNF